MTKIFHSVSEWQTFRRQNLFDNKQIGFVPTMGNLHKGHYSLLTRSVQENNMTVLSLFVNPTQFDNPDDLKNYPRTLEEDIKIAKDAGVDFIFCPEYKDLYPDNYHYRIIENELSQKLCGKHRPGHFDGMLTIVLKLLCLTKPNNAYFGEKDFQQLQLVKEMVNAFFLDVNIVPCQIVRDENGLALSSRNSRLTPDQYRLALSFPKLLNSTLNSNDVVNELMKLGFVVDYIEDHHQRRFGAVRLGNVRLIDNFPLGVN